MPMLTEAQIRAARPKEKLYKPYDARGLLEDGRDPSTKRSEQKAGQGVTFELVAKEWLELQRHVAAATFVNAEWMFNDLINPYIGSRPINEITAPELLYAMLPDAPRVTRPQS